MKKLISVVALAMIVVLMVGMMFGMARIKKAKAQYCAKCVTGCILPNGAPGVRDCSGTEITYTNPYPYTTCSCDYWTPCETFC